ncbi:MAG: hypothetical protein KF841_04815 [Phycisphaerae bacterium]|nr:hypothetical protein [Phycisphaerae bacterium]
MSTFPTGKRSDFLLWAQAHAPVWEAHAGDIGLTPARAAAFGIAVVKLADAERALEEARQAYLAAAAKAQGACRAATREASEAVQLIRAHGGAAKNPLHVYNLAQIAPPRKRSPAPPPAQPARLAATLDASAGSLTLTWKCSNPAGTSGTNYAVRRRLPGETGFTILGIAGKKTFVDDTLPAGVECVEYTVQGQRADRRGAASPILTVQIGRTPATTPADALRHAAARAANAARQPDPPRAGPDGRPVVAPRPPAFAPAARTSPRPMSAHIP